MLVHFAIAPVADVIDDSIGSELGGAQIALALQLICTEDFRLMWIVRHSIVVIPSFAALLAMMHNSYLMFGGDTANNPQAKSRA